MRNQPISSSYKLSPVTAEMTLAERTLVKSTTSKPAVSSTSISFLPVEKTQNVVIENTEHMKDVVVPEIRPVTEPIEIIFSSPDKIFEEKLVESDSHSQEKDFLFNKVPKIRNIFIE